MADTDPFEWEVRDSSTPFQTHALAGSCAGVMEHASMYPLDTVKTAMQASPVRRTASETLQQLLREQGVLRLMRGSTAIGAGCVPAHVAFFGVYEASTAALVDKNCAEQQIVRNAACGAVAAVSHDLILTPHDVVKQRLQLGRYAGIRDCVRQIVLHEGVHGFFRSLPVTLAMNMPYTGILVATNESLKIACCDVGSSEAITDMPKYFFLAGISGAIAAAATMPLDVLKTRLQTQSPELAARHHGGIVAASAAILQQEGFRGFFRGLVPRVMMAAPSAAISWGTYQSVRSALSH